MTELLHTERMGEFESLTLEKIRLMARITFTGDIFRDVEVEQFSEMVAEDLYTATLRLLAPAKKTVQPIITRRFPVTWWDAVKKRFFPRLGFNEETFYERTDIYHVCPHLPMPTCERDAHFTWLRATAESEGE